MRPRFTVAASDAPPTLQRRRPQLKQRLPRKQRPLPKTKLPLKKPLPKSPALFSIALTIDES